MAKESRVFMTQRGGGWNVHRQGVAGTFHRSTEKAAAAARALVESTGGTLEIQLHPVEELDDFRPEDIADMFPGAVRLAPEFGKRFEWTLGMEAREQEGG